MTNRFRLVKSSNVYVVGNIGARIDPAAHCDHGLAAVFIALYGYHHAQPDQRQRLDTLLPRCVLTELVGAVEAQIRHDEGEAAVQAFREEITACAAESYTALQQLRDGKRDCCEAGFGTDGLEHTCGRNEATG